MCWSWPVMMSVIRRWCCGRCCSFSRSLLLAVVPMLVRLHVGAEVVFGCRPVVADFAAVGFLCSGPWG